MKSKALETTIARGVISSARSSAPKQRLCQHKFYGDYVNGLMLGIVTPFFAWKIMMEMYEDMNQICNLDAVAMFGFTGISAISQYLAWTHDSLLCSRIGFLGNCIAGSYMELKEWPVKGVCTITARFQAGILTLCLANITLSVREKCTRLVLMFVIGSYVSIKSPYSVYAEDTLPNLGGAILIAIVLIHIFETCMIWDGDDGGCERSDNKVLSHSNSNVLRLHLQKDEFIIHSARFVMAAVYIHHIFKLFIDFFAHQSNDVMEGIIDLAKSTMIAGIGSVATGVFKTNIDQKEQLELLVRERTQVIHFKTKELRRINVAFEACETAIAITDSSRVVIWANNAFEKLAKRTTTVQPSLGEQSRVSATSDTDALNETCSSVGRQLTDVIVLNDSTNETKLRGAFDFLSPRHDEINIIGDDCTNSSRGKSDYRLEVTPFVDYDEGTKTISNDNDNNLFLVAFHDITADRARKQAENMAREEALLSKAMKESMVTLTHELRTPLQGIMGITSLLLEQDRDAKHFNKDALESLGLVMASSRLLLNLINNLLDIKKATANMMDEFLLTPLLATDPIRDAIDFCKPLASISMVKIAMECSDGTAEAFVNANALRLQQVLINIISNAIKYTDRGTTIQVRTTSMSMKNAKEVMGKAIACSHNEDEAIVDGKPVLVFSISDAGVGIDSHQARLLFRRFARLDLQPINTLGINTIGQPSGTGLGLHLCKMFVQRMHGSLWASNNEDGKGSTFSFCLPLVSALRSNLEGCSATTIPDARKSEVKENSPLESLSSNQDPTIRLPPLRESMDFRRFRVLVVDDTLINRKVFDRMLKKIGIIHVCMVESGAEALGVLFSNNHDRHYDVVIADLQMPGMSGTELTREIIKRKPDPSGRPVVIGLTANSSPDVAEKCAASGMSDVLYKPITLTETKEYFQKVIGQLQPGIWYKHEKKFL